MLFFLYAWKMWILRQTFFKHIRYRRFFFHNWWVEDDCGKYNSWLLKLAPNFNARAEWRVTFRELARNTVRIMIWVTSCVWQSIVLSYHFVANFTLIWQIISCRTKYPWQYFISVRFSAIKFRKIQRRWLWSAMRDCMAFGKKRARSTEGSLGL